MESPRPLSRALIVEVALSITRERGLRHATMRAVGTQLQVSPMALYRYIGKRDELDRLIVDEVGAAFSLTCGPDADWEEKVRDWARTQRHHLRRYPGVATWLMEHGPAGSQAYRILDNLAQAFVDGGFSDAEVARATTLVMSWTFSRIAIEDNADRRREAQRPNRARAFVSGLTNIDAAEHPTAARIGNEFFLLQMDEIFDVGVDVIIRGLRRGHDSSGG